MGLHYCLVYQCVLCQTGNDIVKPQGLRVDKILDQKAEMGPRATGDSGVCSCPSKVSKDIWALSKQFPFLKRYSCHIMIPAGQTQARGEQKGDENRIVVKLRKT